MKQLEHYAKQYVSRYRQKTTIVRVGQRMAQLIYFSKTKVLVQFEKYPHQLIWVYHTKGKTVSNEENEPHIKNYIFSASIKILICHAVKPNLYEDPGRFVAQGQD